MGRCVGRENLGYAMLERITLSIGNGGEVEVLSGEVLNIQNEMFKDSGNRLHNHILKTSVTPFPTTGPKEGGVPGVLTRSSQRVNLGWTRRKNLLITFPAECRLR